NCGEDEQGWQRRIGPPVCANRASSATAATSAAAGTARQGKRGADSLGGIHCDSTRITLSRAGAGPTVESAALRWGSSEAHHHIRVVGFRTIGTTADSEGA